MRIACCSALLALCMIVGVASGASAAERCVAYGDDNTDFTWLLCPAGEKYERQYRYFGVWSKFYGVKSYTGACDWSAPKSSWVCPEKVIRCDAKRCGTS